MAARRSSAAFLFLAAAGCYASHERPDRADASDAFVRDDAGAHDGFVDTFVADDGTVDVGPGDAPSADLPDGTCAAIEVMPSDAASVLFVVDRSGSMTMTLVYRMWTRWTGVENALIGMPSGIVTRLQDDVRFGALMYSDDVLPAGCPDVASTPAVIHGYDAIASLYATQVPGGDTPTGDTIAWVVANLDTVIPSHATGRTVLVLATDGEPGTCANASDVAGGRALVVDRVAAAHAMGIDTYVISVGDGVSDGHLQDVANAGVGAPPGGPSAPYWVATDVTGLEDALRAIVAGRPSCTVELTGSIDPARACLGTVTLDGAVLTCGTDWQAADATHVTLLGDACDRFSGGMTTLTARFPCEARPDGGSPD